MEDISFLQVTLDILFVVAFDEGKAEVYPLAADLLIPRL